MTITPTTPRRKIYAILTPQGEVVFIDICGDPREAWEDYTRQDITYEMSCRARGYKLYEVEITNLKEVP